MNTGAFGEGFPYTNFHNLNMDWIIKIAKDFLDQYTHIQDVISQGLTDLDDKTTAGLTSLQDKADTLEGLLQAWYNTHSQDIANQLANAILELNQQLATNIASFNSSADAKALATIATIPDDYTTLFNRVVNNENSIVDDVSAVASLLNKVTSKDGYISSAFFRQAWNFTNKTKVAVDTVLMSENISAVHDSPVFINFPSTKRARITFLNSSGTILDTTSWITTPSIIYTSNTSLAYITVEFAYVASSAITNIREFLSDVSIYYAPASDSPFNYGAYDFINSVWVPVNTVLHATFPYTDGHFVEIKNHNPSLFRYRLSFFNGTTSVGTTSWQTTSFEGRNINNATSISVEIGYSDNRTIIDREAVINNFEINPQPTNEDIENITTIGIFDKWATIGDSFSIGRWYIDDHGSYVPVKTSRLAWGSIIAREVGNTFLSLGVGGISTRTWLTAPASSGGGLQLALQSPPQELYFLCLGINDTSLGLSYIGSVGDINDSDYHLNEDTFYGNYGRIIQQMKEHSPNALFIMSKLIAWNDSSVKNAYNSAIEGIATHFGIPVVDPYDDSFFYSDFYQENRESNNGHPTGMLYGGIAMAYRRLINKCIYDNPTYFVTYNGTPD